MLKDLKFYFIIVTLVSAIAIGPLIIFAITKKHSERQRNKENDRSEMISLRSLSNQQIDSVLTAFRQSEQLQVDMLVTQTNISKERIREIDKLIKTRDTASYMLNYSAEQMADSTLLWKNADESDFYVTKKY